MFLVSGAGKAPAVRAILGDPDAADRCPAARVRPLDGSVLWIVDADVVRGPEPRPTEASREPS
jgi:6-phosphogluconolactonase/glucosamine-6-phosphate isomerase/deaminase